MNPILDVSPKYFSLHSSHVISYVLDAVRRNRISIRGSVRRLVGWLVGWLVGHARIFFFYNLYGMLIPNLKSFCLYRVKFLRYDFFLNFKFIDTKRKKIFLNAILTHLIFFNDLYGTWHAYPKSEVRLSLSRQVFEI